MDITDDTNQASKKFLPLHINEESNTNSLEKLETLE